MRQLFLVAMCLLVAASVGSMFLGGSAPAPVRDEPVFAVSEPTAPTASADPSPVPLPAPVKILPMPTLASVEELPTGKLPETQAEAVKGSVNINVSRDINITRQTTQQPWGGRQTTTHVQIPTTRNIGFELSTPKGVSMAPMRINPDSIRTEARRGLRDLIDGD